MAQTFHLRIVTPTQQVVREETEEMQVPGKEGYLGILAGHAPLLSELKIGEITYRQGRELRRLAVSWGFVEVLPEQVTVLAETAEKSSDIDVSRAQASKERAERRLSNPDPDTDMNRTTVALHKALSRLQVASRGK